MNDGKRIQGAPRRVSTPPQAGNLNKWMDWWWIRVPAFAARFSKMLAAILADGIYLTAWPPIGATVPPLAWLLGFLIGWLQFFGQTFSFSIVGMALMLLVASAGSALGAWTLIGYAMGDFILGQHPSYYYSAPLETFTYVRIPLVLSYVLLGMLLITVPWASALLRRRTVSRLRAERIVRMMVDAVVQGALAALLVFVWIQSTPTLIRPVFTWQGGSPPIEAIRPLQENGIYLVIIATLAAIGRIVAEYSASVKPQVLQRVAALRALLARIQHSRRWQLPAPVRAVMKALFLTFMLAGVLTDWLDAILFAVIGSGILVMRSLVMHHLSGWVRIATRIPVLIRIGCGILVSYLVARMVMDAMWFSTSTFRPVTISVTISLLVFALILPEAAARQKQAAATSRSGA